MVVWYTNPGLGQSALEEATTGMGQFMFPGRPGQDQAAHAFRFEQRFAQPAGAGPMWGGQQRIGENPYASGQFQQHAAFQQQAPDWRQAYQVMGPVAGAGGWSRKDAAGKETGTRPGAPNKQMQQAARESQALKEANRIGMDAATKAREQGKDANEARAAAFKGALDRFLGPAAGARVQQEDARRVQQQQEDMKKQAAVDRAQEQQRQVPVNAPMMRGPFTPTLPGW